MPSSHTRAVYLLALLAACGLGATAAEVDRPISVYIMTDMEGVAGVLDFEHWTSPESRYYDVGKEAQALVTGIETVAVKRGTTPGRGDECDTETYAKRNLGAIHFQPERARQMIRTGAERAIRRALADPSLGMVPLKPPFERVTILRAQQELPQRIGRSSHPDNVISLMNAPMGYETMK